MRLKYQFEKIVLDDEIVAVPVGEDADKLHVMLRINGTASEIMDLLKDDISEDAIVSKLQSIYDIDSLTLTEHVRKFTKTLFDAGVLS